MRETATHLKPYSGTVIAPSFVDARHADGRRASQCRAAVLASSKAAAIRHLAVAGLRSVTRTEFDRRWSVTGNRDTIIALSEVDAGVVLFAPLDPGGTVRGAKGWVYASKGDESSSSPQSKDTP